MTNKQVTTIPRRVFINSFVYMMVLYINLIVMGPTKNQIKPKKRLLDTNFYKYEEFKNGMKAIKITKENLKTSSCAFSVKNNINHGFNPGFLSIIAYLQIEAALEIIHKVDLKTFLERYNLSMAWSNTFDFTTFYFASPSENFVEALSQCLYFLTKQSYTPKMIGNAMKKEEEKYQNNLNSVKMKMDEIFSIFSDKKYNLLTDVNTELLFTEENPKAYDSNIKKMLFLEKIRNQIFFTSEMTATFIHHTDILNVIKPKIETLLFYERKDNSLIHYNAMSESPGSFFLKEYTNKFIYVEPIKNKTEMLINIRLPINDKLYNYSTLLFIRYSLIYYFNGSLLYQYIEKDYSNDIGIECYKSYYYYDFKVKIQLTEKGLEHKKDVLNMFYEYLIDFEYSKDFYNLLKTSEIKLYDYEYREISYGDMKELAMNMHCFPVENIMNFNYIHHEFNETILNNVLNELKKYENWLVLIFSDENDNLKNQKGKFYNAKYYISNETAIKEKYEKKQSNGMFIKVFNDLKNMMREVKTELPKKAFEKIKNNNNINEVHFKKTNHMFVPFKFKEFTEKFDSSNIYKLRGKHGNFTMITNPKFNKEYSRISIKFNTEINQENYFKTYLYFILAQETNIQSYNAYFYLKNFNFNFSIDKTGIELNFHGFTENIISCIKKYFDNFFSINTDVFSIAQKLLINRLKKKETSLFQKRFLDVMNDVFKNVKFDNDNIIKKITEIKKEELVLEQEYFFEMFVYSDVSNDDEFLNLYFTLFDQIKSSIKIKFTPNTNLKVEEIKTEHEDIDSVRIIIKNEAQINANSFGTLHVLNEYFGTRYFDNKNNDGNEMNGKQSVKGSSYLYFYIEGNYSVEELQQMVNEFVDERKKAINNGVDVKLLEKENSNPIPSIEKIFFNELRNVNYLKDMCFAGNLDSEFKNKVIDAIKDLKNENLTITDKVDFIKSKKND